MSTIIQSFNLSMRLSLELRIFLLLVNQLVCWLQLPMAATQKNEANKLKEGMQWFPLTVTRRSYLSLTQIVKSNDFGYFKRISCKKLSFGVVLLELIAVPKTVGKFGDGVDIVRWVRKTILELAQWVPSNKHHKPVQECHHVRLEEACDEGSRAHDHQSSSVHCGIASCHALAF